MKSPQYYHSKLEALILAARPALENLKENIREAGGCDHSAGICMCREISIAEKLSLALKEAEGF